MTCDTKYKQEALSHEWTAAEVTEMEQEIKLARMKASRSYTERNPYGTASSRRRAEDRAERNARQEAHDRHVLRMFRDQGVRQQGDAKEIPHRHTHAKSEA